MLDDLVEAKRGGICGIMGDRYINHSNRSVREPASQMAEHDGRSIWYKDANNLYGYAMMQKLPHKGFEYITKPAVEKLNTQDDSDHCSYIVCDINYTKSSKDRTEQLALVALLY